MPASTSHVFACCPPPAHLPRRVQHSEDHLPFVAGSIISRLASKHIAKPPMDDRNSRFQQCPLSPSFPRFGRTVIITLGNARQTLAAGQAPTPPSGQVHHSGQRTLNLNWNWARPLRQQRARDKLGRSGRKERAIGGLEEGGEGIALRPEKSVSYQTANCISGKGAHSMKWS